MKKSKTQLSEASEHIDAIAQHLSEYVGEQVAIDGLHALKERLEKVLERASNSPPEGSADGTINKNAYGTAQRIAAAIRELEYACDEWAITSRQVKR